jgi:hypothetical protein
MSTTLLKNDNYLTGLIGLQSLVEHHQKAAGNYGSFTFASDDVCKGI